MDPALGQSFFKDEVYQLAAAAGRAVPWDIGEPQPALVTVAHIFKGAVVDVGCGVGDNSIWASELPAVTSVTGVELAAPAVAEARRRVAAAGSSATIVEGDVLEGLPFRPESFSVLLDCSFFHCIGDDDAQRRYLANVTPLVERGGRCVMLCFSDANPNPWRGPRRVSATHARAMWEEAGWTVDSINESVRVHMAAAVGGNRSRALLMLATRH